MSLRSDYGDDFSRSAFVRIDGEENIVGKFGRITQFPDGTYDVWFVGPNLTPLTGRRLAIIRKNFSQEGRLNELTGEAYARGRGHQFVLRMAALAGVKRKRRVSRAMRKQLERMSAARSSGGREA